MSKLYKLNLQLFANANPQGTTTEALSVEKQDLLQRLSD